MRGFGNLGGLGNMGNLMKQAQKAMQDMQNLEQELANTKLEGSAGGGMVRVEITGAGVFENVEIDPQVVDPEDVEMLQDLVLSAFREAQEKANALKREQIEKISGGLPIPPGMMG
ncbi:MAG: YbaB/EbfC family nucleoid-associated protein [Armatimonadota bacterium]